MSRKEAWEELKGDLRVLKDWLIRHMPVLLLNILAAVFSGLVGLSEKLFPGRAWVPVACFVASVVFLSLASWATNRREGKTIDLRAQIRDRERDVDSLKRDIGALEGQDRNTRRALNRMLTAFAERMLIKVEAQKDPCIRATLYGSIRLDDGRYRFVPLARKSHNPTLERIGRKSYPDDEGFIQDVWEKGATTWRAASKTERGCRSEFVNRFNMPEGTVRALTMIPNAMAGIRLDDADGKHVGMLILESNNEEDTNFLIDHLDVLQQDDGMVACVSEAIGSLGSNYLETLAQSGKGA